MCRYHGLTPFCIAWEADIGIGLFCKLQICGGEEVTSRSAFSKHVKCTQRTHRDSRLASPHLFLPLTRPADRPGRHHVTFPGGLQRSKPTRRNSIRHGGRPLDWKCQPSPQQQQSHLLRDHPWRCLLEAGIAHWLTGDVAQAANATGWRPPTYTCMPHFISHRRIYYPPPHTPNAGGSKFSVCPMPAHNSRTKNRTKKIKFWTQVSVGHHAPEVKWSTVTISHKALTRNAL